MRILIASILILGLVSAQGFLAGPTMEKSPFGAIVTTEEIDDVIHQEVVFPEHSIFEDYVQRAEHLESLTDMSSYHGLGGFNSDLATCADRSPDLSPTDYFTFAPVLMGNLITEEDSIEYLHGRCF